MSEPKIPARPSQVTMAGWVAAIGSALLVGSLFESMSTVRSVETREAVDEFLSTPPGNGLGLDAPQMVEVLRGLMLFTGAAAAAAAVFAIYVLRRNNAARVGYTIAAVAIMLTTPVSLVSGGYLPILIAFAAMMMWTKPARDWFSGTVTTPARQEQKGSFVSSENHPPTGDNPPPEGSDDDRSPRMPAASSDRPVPPPTQGFGSPPQPDRQSGQPSGQQPGQPSGQQPGGYPGQGGPYPGGQYGQGQQPQYGQPYGQQPPAQSWAPPAYGQQPQQYTGYPGYSGYPGYPGYSQPRDPDKRPAAVTAAAWVTWVLTGLTIALFLVVAFFMAVAKDAFVEGMQQEPDFQRLDVSTDDVILGLWVMTAVVLLWGSSAIVLAWFAYRRANWARITLVVSSGVMALVSLFMLPASILHLLGAGAVIVLLFVGGANQWYSRKGGGYPTYPSYPQYAQQYGQQPYGGPGTGYGQQPYGQPPHPGQYPGQGETGQYPGQGGTGQGGTGQGGTGQGGTGQGGTDQGGQQGQPPYGQQQGQPPYGQQQGQPDPYGQPPGGDKEPPKNVW